MIPGGRLLNRADQIADLVRLKIREGYWKRRLPPQRSLALELGTSRRSLTEALLKLEQEGLLINRRQGGTFIVQKRRNPSDTPLSVGIVFSSQSKELFGRQIQVLNTVRQFLQTRKVYTEIHKAPYLQGDKVSNRFKRLIRETTHHCWILVAPPAAMQIWCAENHVPTLVYGVAHPSSNLPNVAVDHFAVARHAAGEILRKGHRHLAVILPDQEKGEDIQCRLGFEDGVRSSPHDSAVVDFAYHDRSVSGVCRLADRLLAAKPRPTAWLICRQGHFLSIFCHLLRRKVDVPRELSLVSRDSDYYFGIMVPEPTRYVVNFDLNARRAAREVLRIIKTQSTQGESLLVIPNFVPGGTLGPAPSNGDHQ